MRVGATIIENVQGRFLKDRSGPTFTKHKILKEDHKTGAVVVDENLGSGMRRFRIFKFAPFAKGGIPAVAQAERTVEFDFQTTTVWVQ